MSTKVFVGNLAFRTTDQALQEAFSKHGDIKSGVIITRGRRSLGYGFVEFSNAEQAAASVDKMNKAEIFGRQIKVELAKDIAERPDMQNEGAEVGPAKRRRRARDDGSDPSSGNNNNYNNSSNNNSNNYNSSNNNSNSNYNGNSNYNDNNNYDNSNSDRPRRKRPPRRKNNDNQGNQSGGSSPSQNMGSGSGDKQPRAPREPRPPREPRAPREPRENKEPREPRAPREKVPSKTTLFVANLPFSIDDAQLLATFTNPKAKAAHVARTRTGRSRGYGFVEFENEADQLEALQNCNGKEIVGANGSRNLSLTISTSPPPAPADATGAAAPTESSPATPAASTN